TVVPAAAVVGDDPRPVQLGVVLGGRVDRRVYLPRPPCTSAVNRTPHRLDLIAVVVDAMHIAGLEVGVGVAVPGDVRVDVGHVGDRSQLVGIERVDRERLLALGVVGLAGDRDHAGIAGAVTAAGMTGGRERRRGESRSGRADRHRGPHSHSWTYWRGVHPLVN